MMNLRDKNHLINKLISYGIFIISKRNIYGGVCLKRKFLLSAVLVLVLCFSVVLATNAAQPTAKDLILLNISNFDLGINKGFYEKSQDVTSIKISEFDGSLTKELSQVKGASIDLLTQVDASQNVIKIGYNTDITGHTHSGSIYLKDNKVILTKDIFLLLKELGLDVFKDNPALLEQSNEYLCLSDEQLKSIWEQMTSYQNQQLPEEYKELLIFLVEAIPDQYFSLSTGKVTLKLDQNGLEDVIYNLLTKVKDEKERVAGIVIGLNKYNFEQMGINPEQLKQEIITSIDTMPVITREQIKLFSYFVEVKDFTYEAALLPGGPKKFHMDLGFKAPDGSAEGQFALVTNSVGAKDDLKESYSVSGGFNAINGPQFDFSLNGLTNYEAKAVYSDSTIKAAAKDNSTGELLLNLHATVNSTTKVDQQITVNTPELNASNSTDITTLIPKQAEAPTKVVVNGNTLEAELKPFIKDNAQIMVPARAVLEELGCEVDWYDPGELHITAGDKVISVFINERSYQVNGLGKTLSVPACLEEGITMIPVSFLVEELGTSIELVNGTVVITK